MYRDKYLYLSTPRIKIKKSVAFWQKEKKRTNKKTTIILPITILVFFHSNQISISNIYVYRYYRFNIVST